MRLSRPRERVKFSLKRKGEIDLTTTRPLSKGCSINPFVPRDTAKLSRVACACKIADKKKRTRRNVFVVLIGGCAIPGSSGWRRRKKRTDAACPPITESPITMSFPGGNCRIRGSLLRSFRPKLHVLLAWQANSDRFACVELRDLAGSYDPIGLNAPPFSLSLSLSLSFSFSLFLSVVRTVARQWYLGNEQQRDDTREKGALKRKIINVPRFRSPLGNLPSRIFAPTFVQFQQILQM